MTDRIQKQLDFIIELDKMKSIFRHTILTDRTRRENDAEHSFHIASMAFLLREHSAFDDVNLSRVVQMLLVHDLVEIDAGDTFAYDDSGNSTKEERENRAAARIFGMLPEDQGAPLEALWREFDAMETHDAKFAAALDRLQPMLNNLHTDGHTWWEGGVTLDKIKKRAAPIREALPAVYEAVWPQISSMVEDVMARVERGEAQPDGKL